MQPRVDASRTPERGAEYRSNKRPQRCRKAVESSTGQAPAELTVDRLVRELRAISSCNQTLMRAENEQTLLDDICRIVCCEAGYRMAWVGFAERDEAKTVRPVASAGFEDGYVGRAAVSWAETDRGRGPIGVAIRTGRTVCLQDCLIDVRAAPWRSEALRLGFRSSIALPLKDEHGAVFGSLNIYSAASNAFPAEEIRLLEELAGDLAFGIAVLRARAERQVADRDLRNHERRLRTLVQTIPDLVWLKDVNGVYLSCNPQFERMVGPRRERDRRPDGL